MKWVKLPQGDRLHAVLEANLTRTLCGMSVVGELLNEAPHEHRCSNCDKRWRHAGRETRPKPKQKYVKPGTVYRPRFKFTEFE